jgi:hypothetical protein
MRAPNQRKEPLILCGARLTPRPSGARSLRDNGLPREPGPTSSPFFMSEFLSPRNGELVGPGFLSSPLVQFNNLQG